MIVGIGTDIIEIKRIKNALEKTEDSFLDRIFTEEEKAYFKKNNYNNQSIAGGFAAKEAVMKSLGTGLRGFSFTDIEIYRDDLGKPHVRLYNNAEKIAEDKGIKIIHLSISHCKDYAIAYATAENKIRGLRCRLK
ncbi:MAG: holo-ACP synthase [Clostridiales bacterium]|nr:holo-ACP synthase [Clostridiales bacterium]